jgi:group II intron reverse transcriptase/maturase
MSFLTELRAVSTLRRAWEQVAARRGVAGIDRITIDDFGVRLEAELQRLSEEIRAGRYRPLPVLRLRPPFLASSDRALVVPAIRDRVVQRAISDLLSPAIEPTLSPACRAFRKGLSAVSAAEDVSRWIESGQRWVLRADVKSFFDTIDPELLHDKVAPFVDPEGLRFLDRILRFRVFDHDQITDMVEGIAQGSPLSPLLGNLFLSDLDTAVLAEHPCYLRYCDDLIVLGSQEEVNRAHERIAQHLAGLHLALNEEKTRVCRAEDGFAFLGYHFGATGRGPAVKAVEALRFRLDELSRAEVLDVAAVDALYRGWTNYFGTHVECWTTSPAGFLALLRASGACPLEELVAARWQLSSDPGPSLALALARAWSAAGREEQAWLELAGVSGGSRTGLVPLDDWSELLRLPPDELVRLTRRLVGPPAERLAALAEALAELGRFEVASRLSATSLVRSAPPAISPFSPENLAEVADYPLLLEFFQGREGIHAVESVDQGGHRSFAPVHQPMAADDWRAHLRGETTLALCLVRAGNTVFHGVLDVDIERQALAERSGRPDELLGRALGTALRLRTELERRGCSSLLEFSGHRGYHLWIRLEEPVSCLELRRWLLDVIRAVGPLPEGIHVEEFPNRDRVRPETFKPVMKLPLGVHSKTGKRCSLLDQQGKPLADPLAVLRALPRLSSEVIREAAGELVRAPRPTAEMPPPGIGPRARRMLEGCHVLGYLARRAEETSYLNHRERFSLLCALGHLGDEGAAALHAIISHTYNYRPEITTRYLGRLPPSPISCPKLRELHPEAAALGACKCDFDLRGRGYPTPLLFALPVSEVPAFRSAPGASGSRRPTAGRSVGTSSPAVSSPRAGPGAQDLRQEAEERLHKLTEMRRHRQGIEAAIARLRRELAELFESASTDTLETSLGRLRRVRREAGDGWDFVIEV